MSALSRWCLVLVAALPGLATGLSVPLPSAQPPDDCCVADECCCALEEDSCCSAEEQDSGPRWMARCACGRHGPGAALVVARLDWTLATRVEVPTPGRHDGIERGYGAVRFAAARTFRSAPEPPPPRS